MNFDLKAIVLVVIFTAGASAHAQTAPVAAACPLTGPGVLACFSAGLVVGELVQIANGKQPLSPQGAGMQVVNGVGDVAARSSAGTVAAVVAVAPRPGRK